jgi:hypothetical protein
MTTSNRAATRSYSARGVGGPSRSLVRCGQTVPRDQRVGMVGADHPFLGGRDHFVQAVGLIGMACCRVRPGHPSKHDQGIGTVDAEERS